MDAPGPRPADAAHQLSDIASVRIRIEQRTDYRSYGWIQTWAGVLLAAYVGTFVTAQSASRSGTPWPALVLPVLLACALALIFTLVLLGTFTSWLTVPMALGGGVLIALPLTVTAFLPAHHGRG
jgi:ATP/ADP translocase